MASFQIGDAPTQLALTADAARRRSGSVGFPVRNVTSRALTARIRVEPQEEAQKGWFSLEGAPSTSPIEIERDFEPQGNQLATVKVAVPPDAAPGDHVFRLRVTGEQDPETDFVIGPAVKVTVPALPAVEPPPPARFPWWAVVVAAVLVLLVAGGLTYAFWPRTAMVQVEDLKGKTVAAATDYLTGLGLTAKPSPRESGAADGKVQASDPDTPGSLAAGTTVTLFYRPLPVQVEDLKGASVGVASQYLVRLGLQAKPSPRQQGEADGKVQATDPDTPAMVRPGASIILYYRPLPPILCGRMRRDKMLLACLNQSVLLNKSQFEAIESRGFSADSFKRILNLDPSAVLGQ